MSEFPAGLDRDGLEYIMELDDDVRSFERIEGATAMWRVVVERDGQGPVEMFVDNGLNEIFVQAFVRIDSAHLATALETVQTIGIVGLVTINGDVFIRSGFLIGESTIHAFTNCYGAVAIAYHLYHQAIH
ncbi:hypothetical protein SAMN06298212_12720 [Ruaniaceae bacterium KH17]|nr:hypothetical protein SAMN06298212_12720 [Ruaniaceae bacterium KH17]